MVVRKYSDMRKYQLRFVRIIIRVLSSIITLPMGAGKTVIVLTAIEELLYEGLVEKVLIVAPKNVAQVTWPDEFGEWEHLQHLRWSLLRIDDDDDRLKRCRKNNHQFARNTIGLEVKEAAKFAGVRTTAYKEWLRQGYAIDDSEIHIVNKEALVWLWEFFGEGKDWPYDMVIYDESSMFKNAKSKRTENGTLTRYMVAKRIRKYTKRAVLLSGTVAPKGLINLFGQLFIVDGGERLGRSKTKYLKEFFIEDYNGFSHTPIASAFKTIMGRVVDVMFGMREEDCVSLPPRIDNIIKVRLSKSEMVRYAKFEKTMIDKYSDIEAVNRGVLTLKLLQFANGSMYDENHKTVFIHDKKLEALETIVDEANGMPVLVAYTFTFDKDRIKKRFGKRCVIWGEDMSVAMCKRKWNAGEIEIMIAHPESIGHGQNIQYGGNIMVWYGLTNDLEHYDQMNKRLHRSGQSADAVFIHHIVALGTRDEKVLPVLAARGATQDDINNAVLIDLSEDNEYSALEY